MFEILNGGVYAGHDSNFFMNRPRGFDSYVLLITHTKAVFRFGEAEYDAVPHQAVLIAPHTPYSYYNPVGAYTDDWLHFNCSEDDLSAIDMQAFHKPFSLDNPSLVETCLQQLLYENSYAPEELRDFHIDSIFKVLISHLMYGYRHVASSEYSPYLHPMQKLRLRMQSEPQNAGTAKEAADEIGISLSYFQHLYTYFFKTSYQKDLIQMRISYSEELLRTTDMSIEDIATACGYASAVHFYRQFRSINGVTPGRYR
ncbi:MAG: AraC family transcriptional regulator [Lachnospiraceae bacterium]|nr:AraC family transcriptional regulator [Lachnospiraceae bacterium]